MTGYQAAAAQRWAIALWHPAGCQQWFVCCVMEFQTPKFEGDVLLFVLSTSVFCPAAGWAGQVQLCFSFKGIKD